MRTPLEFETVLNVADRDAVTSGVIAKRLNELKYESVRAGIQKFRVDYADFPH